MEKHGSPRKDVALAPCGIQLSMSPEQFEQLLPLATAWAEEQEARVLASGVGLTPAQVSDAREVGVAHPERVRLLRVPSIPIPVHPLLVAAADATGLISPFTA